MEETPLTVKFPAGVSTSATVNGIELEVVFWLTIWLGMFEMVGASLVALTVTEKLVLVEPKLVSVTEMVMVEAPNRFVAGVTVTVRLAPLPPKTMFDTGTTVGLEEFAASVNCAVGVVSSPMVNGMAAVRVSSPMT